MEPLQVDGSPGPEGAGKAHGVGHDAGGGSTERDFAALLDALPQIVWTCDADGDHEISNSRWSEFTGDASASPEKRQEAIHPQDRERTVALWRRALTTGEAFEGDFRLRRYDGAYRWQLARAMPQRDAAGRILRWVGTATDIEAQFRAVHESAIDGFMLMRAVRDEEGRIVDFVWLYVNEAAGRTVGRSREWFAGRRLLEEMPGNRTAGLFEAYVRVVESGEPWSGEVDYAHEGLDLDVRIAATRADDGVALSFADLTERRRSERQVRHLQARQAFLLALGDRLRALTDPHATIQAAAQMLGRHLGAARCGYAEFDEDGEAVQLEHGWDDGSMPAIAGRHRFEALGRPLFAQLRAGEILRIEDTLADPRMEPRSAARTAECGGLRSSLAAPLIKGGLLVAILYVHEPRVRRWSDDDALLLREVAERTGSAYERARALRALQLSEQRLRLATEGVGLGTWEADIDTHEGRWSASNFRLLGYEPPPDGCASSGAFSSRLHPDDRHVVEDGFVRLLRGEGSYQPEYRILRADTGEVRWLASFGRLVEDSAGPGAPARRIVGVSLDITDRKRLEAEREILLESERAARGAAESAARAKDEFLATLSHELRTPLSVIISWSRVLQRRLEGGDPELCKGLKVIAANAFAQSQLITDLLDMSRIVSGKLTLEVRPCELRDIVTDAVDAHAPVAAAKGVALALHAPSGEGSLGRVLAEAGRLHQVLGNLLSNAIKFTPPGGAVEVRVARAGACCEIRVRDTGEGLAADFLPQLFSRFRQAEGGAARRHGGLGLGLSVVRNLVEMHGGTVDAASDGPGCGATFTVRLPLHDGPQAPGGGGVAPVPRSEILEAGSLAGLRVLAVEDEPSMREYLARVLEEHGAKVVAVDSALKALEALGAAGPRAGAGFDLLVSDIGLPGTDGLELIRTVRGPLALGPARLGAVALTAFARDEDRRRCLEAGYQAHIAKPYRLTRLIATLRQVAPRPPAAPADHQASSPPA